MSDYMPWATPMRQVVFDLFAQPDDDDHAEGQNAFWKWVAATMRTYGGKVGHLETTFEDGLSLSIIDNGKGVFLKKRRFKARGFYEHRVVEVSEEVYQKMREFAERLARFGLKDADGRKAPGTPFDQWAVYTARTPVIYKHTGEKGSWYAKEVYENMFCSELIIEMLYVSGFMHENPEQFKWFLKPKAWYGHTSRLYSGQVTPIDIYKAIVPISTVTECSYGAATNADVPQTTAAWREMMHAEMPPEPTVDRYGVSPHDV